MVNCHFDLRCNKAGDSKTIMTEIRIVIRESDLEMDAPFLKLLAERQSAGIIDVQRVEISDYKVKPPLKKGGLRRKSPRPEDFAAAVKAIVRHAAKQNNQLLSIVDNHVASSYSFWIDDEAWCSVMDKLLAERRDIIEAVLERKQRADSVTLLAPYIGEIIGLKLFQRPQGVQKTDLIKSFSVYYGQPMASVQPKLSTSYPDWYAFNKLVNETRKLSMQMRK